MPFEIFDDVAFYWFLQVLLGIVVVPWSIIRLSNYCTREKKHKTKSHPNWDKIPDYIPQQTLVSEKNETIESKLSLYNIFFCCLWVLFLLLLIQLPRWNNSSLTDFDPYAILNIQQGATESEIKRAYRKQSLLNHPDRCQEEDPVVCNDKFILITKAYQALTDEQTRDNYKKYGNPDGYQGTSVTIGLPSWLTNKDNELVILSVYFIALILLVAIVGGWWSHSSKFHKSGVYKQTIDIYWRFVKQNMRMRHLLDILAASAEFKILDHKIPEDSSNPKFKQLVILEQRILDFLKKKVQKGQPKLDSLFKASYVRRSSALLNSHLIGLPVPNELKEEYLFVLEQAPRLLDVMIDMTLSRERFWAQGLQLIQMKQAIIQGVWPFESNLKQLPHWTEGVDRSLQKKKLKTITQLNFLNKKELRDTLAIAYKNHSTDYSYLISNDNNDDDEEEEDLSHLPENIRKIKEKQRENKKQQEFKKQQKGQSNNKDNNNEKAKIEEKNKNDEIEFAPGTIDQTDEDVEQMVDDAESMVRMYPVVKMNWCARTYDEKHICTGDIVKVTVRLNRIGEPWNFTVDSFKPVEEMEPPELEAKRKRTKHKKSKKKNNKNNNDSKDETDANGDGTDEDNDDIDNEDESSKDVSGKDSIDFEPDEYEDDVGLGFVDEQLDEARRLQIARQQAPVVHVNRFPFRVKEKWMILLVDHAIPQVVDQRAIPALLKHRSIDLHFRIQRPPGKYKYLLFTKSDCYLGCDQHVEFVIDVKESDKVRKAIDKDNENEDEEEGPGYQIPDDEEFEAEPKWYYLWNSTFWEFLLTLFLLYFIYLVLVSTSFGKKWIQPYVEMFWDYCIYPITNLASDKLGKVLFNPLSKQILKLTGFDLKAWWFDIDPDDLDDDFEYGQETGHNEM